MYQSTYDAVVIVRGGGSDTYFLVFDHYDVARAIAKFPIPIIVGIGHHINETIADLMAHTSTKTPSIAAEFILSHNKKFEDNIIALGNQISVRSLQSINRNRDKLLLVKSVLTGNGKNKLKIQERKLNVHVSTVINKSRQVLSKQHNSLEKQFARSVTKPYVVIANSQKTLGEMNSAFIYSSRTSIGVQKELLSFEIHSAKNLSERVLHRKQNQIL